MKKKDEYIIDILKAANGHKSYYIDIRNQISELFDSEEDFDYHIDYLKFKNWIYENEQDDTLYTLNSDMLKP